MVNIYLRGAFETRLMIICPIPHLGAWLVYLLKPLLHPHDWQREYIDKLWAEIGVYF